MGPSKEQRMIDISRHNGNFLLRTELLIPQSRAQVFDFFSKAENLQSITPASLHFQILTPLPITMRKGQIIDYRISLHGIPISWKTLISQWDPPYAFTDEQIRGPYHTWIHQHLFEECAEGTLVIDRVQYWPLGGSVSNYLFVAAELLKIFRYRQQQLKEIFKIPVQETNSEGVVS